MKKNILPPLLNSIILEFVKKVNFSIKIVQHEKKVIVLEVKEPNNDFFFNINSISLEGDKVLFYVNYCPARLDILGLSGESSIGYDRLKLLLSHWGQTTRMYIDMEDIFQNPLDKHFENQFAKIFVIDEEDANITPFDTEKILLLGAYIDKINSEIEKCDYDNIEEKNLVIEEGKSLKQQLVRLSKNEALKKLVSFLAKGAKMGFDVLKEITVNVAADAIKKAIGIA